MKVHLTDDTACSGCLVLFKDWPKPKKVFVSMVDGKPVLLCSACGVPRPGDKEVVVPPGWVLSAPIEEQQSD